jgi:hypothetical protein
MNDTFVHRSGAVSTALAQHPGLYGFAVVLEEPAEGIGEWLTPAPADWPQLQLRRTVAPTRDSTPTDEQAAAGDVEMDEQLARVVLLGGEALMRRDTREACFRTQAALGLDELVHPALGYAALAFANWMGREAFHAGVFLSGERAWALLGERGAGKSSTLAWLARAGQPIVADDVLVLDDHTAFVGPRALDLSSATASHLGWGDGLESVRHGFRLRLALKALAPEHHFAGWVSLAWGDEVAIAPVPAAQRIPLLIEHGHQPRGVANWSNMLSLASLPTFELRRPRTLESLAAAGELLLETTAAAAG